MGVLAFCIQDARSPKTAKGLSNSLRVGSLRASDRELAGCAGGIPAAATLIESAGSPGICIQSATARAETDCNVVQAHAVTVAGKSKRSVV